MGGLHASARIAEQMNVAPSTSYKWVAEGLAEITQERPKNCAG